MCRLLIYQAKIENETMLVSTTSPMGARRRITSIEAREFSSADQRATVILDPMLPDVIKTTNV